MVSKLSVILPPLFTVWNVRRYNHKISALKEALPKIKLGLFCRISHIKLYNIPVNGSRCDEFGAMNLV